MAGIDARNTFACVQLTAESPGLLRLAFAPDLRSEAGPDAKPGAQNSDDCSANHIRQVMRPDKQARRGDEQRDWQQAESKTAVGKEENAKKSRRRSSVAAGE